MAKPIIEVFSDNKSNIIPIWLMRQAGRYLPEYLEIRSKEKNFLNLCYNVELSSIITLQPIKRFGFDAAIIFSDILVLPDAMGVDVQFTAGDGPKLQKIETIQDVERLTTDISEKLIPVYNAIKIVKSSLEKNKTLIGFSGSPWTLATYMIEGSGSKDFFLSKKMAYTNNNIIDLLIKKITKAVTIHLINQIEAGAEVIQLFDTWSGVLNFDNFNKYVIDPTIKIVDDIKKIYPNVPIIGFPKASSMFYCDYMLKTKIDGLSLDSNLPYDYINNNLKNKVVIQGNLDPIYLLADKEILKNKILETLDNLYSEKYIFNLGHGILKETPISNVELMIDIVRNYKK